MPLPITSGGNSVSTGWVRSLAEIDQSLTREVDSLKQRLDLKGVNAIPGGFQARKVFTPQPESFPVDYRQNGGATALVNYVVRDGVTYDIPLRFTDVGVFVANSLKVAMYQRFYVPLYGQAVQMPMTSIMLQWELDPILTAAAFFSTKFSLFPAQPWNGDKFANSGRVFPACNFMWNLVDSRSQHQLNSDLASHMTILPRTTWSMASAVDGGLMAFPIPWVLRQDSQVNFMFRPVTPVLQFDSTVDISAIPLPVPLSLWPYDDREGGVRNQSVTVLVELHGYRFDHEREAMRAGLLP